MGGANWLGEGSRNKWQVVHWAGTKRWTELVLGTSGVFSWAGGHGHVAEVDVGLEC